MDAQRREDITGWDARTFSGGFDGIREHVDDGFSGAVTDGTGWLFLLDGRVIGTVDRELDAFADASGTVYEAPHESLPVLFAMQEQGGTQRAQYYTNDTSLAEADQKLSQGGFTGYVELTENVLSGDYYVAYTAGESMAAAYVGNSRRLETGEKAFELADDEVGIYSVYEVDLDVRSLPEGPSEGETNSAGSTARDESDERDETEESGETSESDERGKTGGAGGAGEAGAERDPQSGDEPSESVGPAKDDASDGTHAPGAKAEDGSADESGATPARSHTDSGPATSENDRRDRTADRQNTGVSEAEAAETKETDANTSASNVPDSSAVTTDAGADGPESVDVDAGPAESSPGSDPRTGTRVRTDEEPPDDEDVFSEEAQWREAKSIPALDPSETSVRGAETDGAERNMGPTRGRSGAGPDREANRDVEPSRSSTAGSNGTGSTEGSPDPRPTPSNQGRAAVSRSGGETDEAHDRIEQLETKLAEAKSERESLATERDALREERDSLTRERDELKSEVEELEAEVEELRAEIERLRTKLTEAESQLPEGDHSLSAAEARDGTNLFIRYESKGGATLEDAHDGTVGRDELRENLRIEHHTSFETDGLSVDGRPFEEFLRDTMEYGFTRWLAEELPFEVGETGNGSALRDLYDALPDIDRAEIGGSVSVAAGNDEDVDDKQAFDLVLRDRMGNPLFAADLNDTRAPTKGASLESLVANGKRVAEANSEFAGAFAVTASFFDPDALEVAGDAVGGGLFGRSKRKSFVKLSRKRGYHLCLVESREGGFHLTVPDL